MSDASCSGLERNYVNARKLLKRANESEDKPISYSIARDLLEGYLKPNYEVNTTGKK